VSLNKLKIVLLQCNYFNQKKKLNNSKTREEISSPLSSKKVTSGLSEAPARYPNTKRCDRQRIEASLPIDDRENAKNFAESEFVLDRLPS
jgi:hypothetical protein